MGERIKGSGLILFSPHDVFVRSAAYLLSNVTSTTFLMELLPCFSVSIIPAN